MIKHKGACLCGEVTFEIEGEFESFFLCHCSRCRKDTGSAHAANLFSSSVTLQWLTGQDKISSFTLPSTLHTKAFCSICGSALPTDQMEGDLLVVPAGSLDSDLLFRPNAHINISSKAEWDQDLEKLPKINNDPETP